jgi:competence protein ComEA
MGEEIPRPEWSTRWHALRNDRRVAAALFACLAVAAAVAWWRAGAASSPALPSTPTTTVAGARSSSTTVSTLAADIVVDVVGAVRRSGIVRLRTGARVVDAIGAAGGATADADLTRLNLAAMLSDGTRVAVPSAGAPPPAVDPAAVIGGSSGGSGGDGSETLGASGPVNLNSATPEQLDTLPGVGPATAAAIVRDREAHGPFASVDDLARVRGIGPAKLEQLRDLVTV